MEEKTTPPLKYPFLGHTCRHNHSAKCPKQDKRAEITAYRQYSHRGVSWEPLRTQAGLELAILLPKPLEELWQTCATRSSWKPYSNFPDSVPSVLSQIQENLTTGGRYSSHLSLGNLCPRESHPHCDSLSFWVPIMDILGHEIYKGHTRSWDLLLFKAPNDCFSLGIYSSPQCRLSLPIKCHFIIALYRSRVAWRHSWHSTFVSFPGSWARSTISNAYWERILFSL